MENIGDLKAEHLIGYNSFYFGVFADILNICQFAENNKDEIIYRITKYEGDRDLDSCTEYYDLIEELVELSGHSKDYGSSYVIHSVVYPFVSNFVRGLDSYKSNAKLSQLESDIKNKTEELEKLKAELQSHK